LAIEISLYYDARSKKSQIIPIEMY
jgi:hypothetical protein